jgi:hypothetical protein
MSRDPAAKSDNFRGRKTAHAIFLVAEAEHEEVEEEVSNSVVALTRTIEWRKNQSWNHSPSCPPRDANSAESEDR